MAVSSPPSLIISMIINLMWVSTSAKSVNNEMILNMILTPRIRDSYYYSYSSVTKNPG